MSKELTIPEVGEGIESGTVVALLVGEGDRVEVDQPVIELETDKAVVEVPSTVAGVVQRVHVKANDEAKIGQVVVTIEEDAGAGAEPSASDRAAPEPAPAERAPSEPGAAEAAAAEAAAREPAAPDPAAPERAAPEPGAVSLPDGRRLIPAAPSVRRIARERGVDIAQVPGTGLLGRISADDVTRIAAGARPGVAPPVGVPAPELPDFARWGAVERAAMSGIRKATLRAMTTAWSSVPMVTHFDKADATELEALRTRHQAAAEAIGAKLTPTALLVKVVAAALKRFPDFNASLDPVAQEIVYKHFVNIGVAVDTEHGLLVPVLRNADGKSVLELAKELGELAERARARKLGLEEMTGGTFSVSNLGGIGGSGFTPIVNPPEVAILGVSRSAIEPAWDEERQDFVPRLTMPLALTYDHRLIDGASAARFLRWVCRAVEDPFLLALEG